MSTVRGLKVLSDYKQKIMEALISDDELVKAIANNGENFLEQEVENPADLIYKQIFPYKWTAPQIPDRKEVYITMNFAIDRLDGGIFNRIGVVIYVFVHKDIMRIFDGEQYHLRSDYILQKIESLLHNSTDFGVGRLELVDNGDIFLSTDLPGFFLVFVTVDQAAR